MKNLIAFGVLLVILSACTSIPAPKLPQRQTLSSFDVPSGTNATRNIPAGMVNFREVELSQMLEFYQDISRRRILPRGRTQSLPRATRDLRVQPLHPRADPLLHLRRVVLRRQLVGKGLEHLPTR
jgi:hypothetical protein